MEIQNGPNQHTLSQKRDNSSRDRGGSLVYFEDMAQVIELKKGKRFTLKEAEAILPVIRKITEEAVGQVNELKAKIEAVDPPPAHRPYYEQQLNNIVSRWSEKVIKLGCEPKGLWLVDFDNGEGYYCWRYPEEGLEFYHTYRGGYASRTPIL